MYPQSSSHHLYIEWPQQIDQSRWALKCVCDWGQKNPSSAKRFQVSMRAVSLLPNQKNPLAARLGLRRRILVQVPRFRRLRMHSFFVGLTVLLQLFFSGLTIYVVINIALRCLWRLPGPKSQQTGLSKDHTRDVWRVIKLQSWICINIAGEVIGNVTTKIYLFCYSILFFIFSKENRAYNEFLKSSQHRWRPNSRPSADSILCEKSVIFMRHG